MVDLPVRRFRAGSVSALWRNDTRPPFQVTLPRALAVARTEITVGQFRQFVQRSGWAVERGCWHHDDDQVWRFDPARAWDRPGFPIDDAHPVTCVSWYDARAYTRWLSGETGADYRLPSESEFDAYVRGPGDPARPAPAALCAEANGADLSTPYAYRNSACSDGQRYTAAVASLRPNAYGMHDTLGNLWEWTADCWLGGVRTWWQVLRAAPKDGRAWTAGRCDLRATRGGSWLSSRGNLAPEVRFAAAAGYRFTSIGFRPVRVARDGAD